MKKTMAITAFVVGMTIVTLTGCGSGSVAPPGPPSAATTPAAGGEANSVDNSASADATGDSSSGAKSAQDALRRNFYFVFDGSGSMRDQPKSSSASADQRFGSKIEGAKWAVNEFLKKIPKNVNLGLFVFDRRGPRQVLPLGSDNRSQFIADIDQVTAHGATPLGTAITKATSELEQQYKKQLGYGEYRMIVITDGQATDSLANGVAQAAKYGIPIYTIGFDMGSDHALRKHSVSYRSADSAKELEKALEEAGAEMDIFDPTAFPSKQSKTAAKY